MQRDTRERRRTSASAARCRGPRSRRRWPPQLGRAPGQRDLELLAAEGGAQLGEARVDVADRLVQLVECDLQSRIAGRALALVGERAQHEVRGVAAHDLQALWSLQRKIMPDTPIPATQPWLWKWDTIFPLAKRAGRDHHDRARRRPARARARKPGPARDLPFTSTTLWGAIQYLGPGESAPAHRHTPSAIRFVMTGVGRLHDRRRRRLRDGAGGHDPTPNWMWHDHNNYGSEPMVWFDGLDLPLMVNLESIFFENHPDLTAARPRSQPLRAAARRPRARARRRARATRSTRRFSATAGATPSGSSRSSCAPAAATRRRSSS